MNFRLLTALLLTIFLLTACREEQPSQPEILRPVRYQMVNSGSDLLQRTFTGTARAGMETRLSFRVAGSVEEIAVKVGDQVKKGALIARLDDTDFRLQVQEARASLANAQAQARNAEASYDRVRALYENRNASRNDLDAARAESESSKAAVRASNTRLELALSQLRYTKLLAPANGAIASVPIEVNENIAAGQTIALLNSGTMTEVATTVPESLIASINKGMTVNVTFDAIPGHKFAAEVTEVGVSAINQMTTFPIRVRLTEKSALLRPGMAAAITFQLPNGSEGSPLMVAPEAISEDRRGRFAFVVEPLSDGRGTIHRRAVTVGELTSAGLEVLSGLKDKELVVTAGVSLIHEGQQVRLLAANEVAP